MVKKIGARRQSHLDYIKDQIHSSAPLARFYGFPECCIGAHELNAYKPYVPTDHPAIGTGYIPCTYCMTRPWEEVKAEITAARLCSSPFPNGHGAGRKEEFKAADSMGLLKLTPARLAQLERKREFDKHYVPATPSVEMFDPRAQSAKPSKPHQRSA